MRIYDGGSDKDDLFLFITYNCISTGGSCFFSDFTENTLSPIIPFTGNQMFLSFTNNGASGKGFSAAFVFGKKIANTINDLELLDK